MDEMGWGGVGLDGVGWGEVGWGEVGWDGKARVVGPCDAVASARCGTTKPPTGFGGTEEGQLVRSIAVQSHRCRFVVVICGSRSAWSSSVARPMFTLLARTAKRTPPPAAVGAASGIVKGAAGGGVGGELSMAGASVVSSSKEVVFRRMNAMSGAASKALHSVEGLRQARGSPPGGCGASGAMRERTGRWRRDSMRKSHQLFEKNHTRNCDPAHTGV